MRFLRKRALDREITTLLSQASNNYLADALSILARSKEDGFTSVDLPRLPYVEWAVQAAPMDEANSSRTLDPVLDRAAAWGHEDDALPLLIQNLLRQLRQLKSERLLKQKAKRGFQPIRTELDGTAVYLDVDISRQRDEGKLLLTDRGLRYVGPVLLEIAWTNVIHLHRENAQDFGVQERKRKTLTKFGFLSGDWNENFAVLEWCWHQFKGVTPPP